MGRKRFLIDSSNANFRRMLSIECRRRVFLFCVILKYLPFAANSVVSFWGGGFLSAFGLFMNLSGLLICLCYYAGEAFSE